MLKRGSAVPVMAVRFWGIYKFYCSKSITIVVMTPKKKKKKLLNEISS